MDLYRAVRQGIRASVESYSIKRLEPLYGFTREIGLRDAGSSIAAFEAWLQVGGERGHDEEILHEIERYNHDDVVSTLRLRDWLEERRLELAALLDEAIPRRPAASAQPAEELSDALAHVEAVSRRLMDGLPGAAIDRDASQQAQWLLAQLLSWHRREDKAFWHRYFELMNDLTDDERVREREPIGLLTYVGEAEQVKKSIVHHYRFPAQEHGVQKGREVRDPATGKSAGTVVRIDEATSTVDLSRHQWRSTSTW